MDKILSNIKERVIYFLDNKGIKKEDFYKKSEIASSNFKGLGGKSELGGDKIVKILTLYPDINPEWLIMGRGEMLRSEPPFALRAPSMKEGIPLIPIEAMAGVASGDISILELECERFVVPVFKGADYLIQVRGSSMLPKYNSGDIVACQKLPLKDLFFQWNKVYVVDTDQGALIKRIKKGGDPNHVTLVSDNTAYDPFELSISQIHAVALVIGVIRLE